MVIRMRICCILAMALLSIFASDALSQGIISDTQLSDQVVEKMADISLAHAAVSATRYVFVATGKRTTIRQGALEEDEAPILYVYAQNPARRFTYAASVFESRTVNFGDLVQNWHQVLKRDGKTFYREGHHSQEVSEYKGKEGERLPRAITYRPILHSLDLASRFSSESTIDTIELLALSDKSTLQDVRLEKNGDLFCKWQVDSTVNYSSSAHVTLAKEFGYMPSRSRFFSLGNPNSKTRTKPRLISDVRTTWKSHDGQFLPTEMMAVDLASNAGTIEHHYEMAFEWRIENELSPDFDIPSNSDDWRKPILAVFKKDKKDWRNWSPAKN